MNLDNFEYDIAEMVMYSVLYDTALLFASMEFSMLHPCDIILHVENCLFKDTRKYVKMNSK